MGPVTSIAPGGGRTPRGGREVGLVTSVTPSGKRGMGLVINIDPL